MKRSIHRPQPFRVSAAVAISTALLQFVIACSIPSKCSAQGKLYHEQFRPRFHYSPPKNWTNDPNGLVYYDGTYNLFYQYNPYGSRWGHMSWGHAVSRDLIHWKTLPVAIKESDGIMIFSGSAVVDWKNTSGFGKDGKPPLLAIYTGYDTTTHIQAQDIAYSNDGGLTWTKYEGNPVIDIHSENFRDPKVFWYSPSHAWIMVVSLAAEHRISFYKSKNLKHWTHLSYFGPDGATDGVWECPDLFRLPVTNEAGMKKWVLSVNVASGAPGGGGGDQYFVGVFNGRTFTAEEPLPVKIRIPTGKVFADFEGAGYSPWAAKGSAFGNGPAHGALEGQSEVSGYTGQGFVDSFHGGDASEGALVSPSFRISQNYIDFLIGGGDNPHKTCMNLVVDGRTVRTATGANDEQLHWRSWDVSQFRGRDARIDIIDSSKGGWGHINLDRIMFSDSAVVLPASRALWSDYGRDFYAVASWNGIPGEDGRRIWIGWMNGWPYGQDIPTHPWRGAQSIPRALSLEKTQNGYRLIQRPIEELKQLREKEFRLTDKIVKPRHPVDLTGALGSDQLEVVAIFNVPKSTKAQFGLKVRKGTRDETLIGYDGSSHELFVDRTHSGIVNFSPDFPGRQSVRMMPVKNRVKIHVFVDRSSVEVFGNNGRRVITDLIFPDPGSKGIEVYSLNGTAVLKSLEGWKLKSIWSGN